MPRAKQPNILLINCDDMGYGDLGCYGSTRNDTPCIDQLAATGLRLTDFYMASPVCSPSRGGMLTGCYPPRIGFGEFDGEWVLFPGQGLGLSAEEETIAGMLRRAGYATGMIGKWHCGDQEAFLPTRHGFDTYFGLPYSNDMGVQAGNDTSDFKLRAGFPPLPLIENERVVEQQPDLAALTERYTARAVNYLWENQDRPFFLYFAHMYVHRPLYAQDRFARESRNGVYGAAMACVDWSTATLLRALDDLGLRENTLVIFTSDNGSRGDAREGCSNLPLRGAKGSTWEGGQRVPCILNWQGVIPAGGVSGELLTSVDFLPTLAALAGAQPQQVRPIDGLDASAFLLGHADRSPRELFAYYHMRDLNAVRDARYKLHVARDDRPVRELYDLREDIGETRNLADALPEVVDALLKAAEGVRRELGDAVMGATGAGERPCGRVAHPRMLTRYDPTHPYMLAMYDKDDCG